MLTLLLIMLNLCLGKAYLELSLTINNDSVLSSNLTRLFSLQIKQYFFYFYTAENL